jgi:hypothetical protein
MLTWSIFVEDGSVGQMGLIQAIFGRATKTIDASTLETVEEVQDALTRVKQQRQEQAAKISAATVRRSELLLLDDTDADIAALECDTEKAQLAIERLELMERELLQRLLALQDAKRRALWANLIERHNAATDDFIAKYEAALLAKKVMIWIVEDARRHGFIYEAKSLTEPLHLLTEEALENFRFYREKNRPQDLPS